jgi:hypothetical protein
MMGDPLDRDIRISLAQDVRHTPHSTFPPRESVAVVKFAILSTTCPEKSPRMSSIPNRPRQPIDRRPIVLEIQPQPPRRIPQGRVDLDQIRRLSIPSEVTRDRRDDVRFWIGGIPRD